MGRESLSSYYSYRRRLSRAVFTSSVLVALCMYLVGYAGVARGLVLGSLFSVLNFAVMAQFLPYQVKMGSRRKAFGIALGSLIARLALMGIPLVVALKTESFNFWAVAAGLFTVPAAVVVDNIGWKRLRFFRIHL